MSFRSEHPRTNVGEAPAHNKGEAPAHNKGEAPAHHKGEATAALDVSRRGSHLLAAAYLLLASLSLAYGMSNAGWFRDVPAAGVWLRFAYGAWVVASGLIALRAVGRIVIRLWGGLPGAHRTTEVLFACAAGSAVAATFLLLLALVGLLTWWTVSAAAFGAIATDAWLVRRRRVQVVALGDAASLRVREFALGAALLVWVAPFLAQVALPVTDHDSVSYHLPFARSLVHSGPFRIDAEFRADNYPAVAHLFQAALYVLGAESAGPLLNLVVACAVPLAVFSMGREFWGPLAGGLAVLFTLSINAIWEVGITLRVDSTLTFFSLMAVFAFLAWRKQPGRGAYLPLVGAMLGMGLGIKYTAVIVAAAVGVAVAACVVLDWMRHGHLRLVGLVIAFVLLLVPSGFWYARNAVVLGDPLYPLLMRKQLYRDATGKLRPYHADVKRLMRRGPSPSRIERELKDSRFAFMADGTRQIVREQPTTSLNLLDVLLRPWLYARKPLHLVCPILALGVFLPFLRRDPLSLWLYLLAGATFLMLAGQTSLVRYVLPAFPLMALGAGVFIAELSRTLARGGRRASGLLAIPVALVVLFLLVISLAEWKKTVDREAFRYLGGREDGLHWMAKVKAREGDPFPQFAVWLDHRKRLAGKEWDGGPFQLAGVFLVAECRGHLLDSPYCSDMSWDANRWCSELVKAQGNLDAVAASMRERQLSHILVNVNFLQRWSHVRLGDEDHLRLAWGLLHLDRFIDAHAEVVVDRAGILLVRLKDPPA